MVARCRYTIYKDHITLSDCELTAFEYRASLCDADSALPPRRRGWSPSPPYGSPTCTTDLINNQINDGMSLEMQ